MKIKTTMEIMDGQFKTKIEEHTLREIRITQPIENIMQYHQKEWIAIDELIEYLKAFPAYTYSSLERDRLIADEIVTEIIKNIKG